MNRARLARVPVATFVATLIVSGGVNSARAEGSYWTSDPVDARLPRGRQLFVMFCEECHARIASGPVGPRGGAGGPREASKEPTRRPRGGEWGMMPGPPGTSELQVKYAGQVPAALEDRPGLSADMIRTVVRNGLGVMPPVRKTELSDAELRTLAEYLAAGGRASIGKSRGGSSGKIRR